MTVLDVHPVGFDTAARVFGDDVAGGVSAAVEALLAALEPCYGMAGTDDSAQHWAPGYDAGARAAVTAFDDLTAAGFRLAALLEQCAINYAGAEAACLPGQTATRSAARWAHTHPARHHPPPAAAGLALPEPDGWSLLAHLIGRVWPDGHQDLLHSAAHAWQAAAATLTDLGPVLSRATREVAAQQHAPDVADAVTVLTHYAGTVTRLADHCHRLADSCTALAAALDHAHSTIGHECLDFLTTTIAAETAGGLLAAVTAGLAEAAAQAVVVRAGLAAAAAIRTAIDTLTGLLAGIATDLDTVAAQLGAVSHELEPTLARTTVQATVTRPGIAGVERGAVGDLAIDRLTARLAPQREVGSTAETWGDLESLEDHFARHGRALGISSADDYARQAALFRRRAVEEQLPTIFNREEGTVRYLDPDTGQFGAYRLDEKTRTYFIPKNPAKYWAKQEAEHHG